MAITSSSTLTQIEAQYLDNASYAEDDSVAAGKLFIEACRAILLKKAKTSSGESFSMAFDLAAIRAELESARDWLNSHPDHTGGTGVTTFVDSRSFR